jgi:hypothetical protein
VGLLEAYWDAYEAVELNTYADYAYLQEVWRYHERIVEAICHRRGCRRASAWLIEHMQAVECARRGDGNAGVRLNGAMYAGRFTCVS